VDLGYDLHPIGTGAAAGAAAAIGNS
jgi:hypothetical protein